MKELAEKLHVRLHKDGAGDLIVSGRFGNIHRDGSGYIVYLRKDTARQYRSALAKLSDFCILRQDGDTEGVLYMAADRIKTRRLCSVLGIKRIRQCSDAQRRALKAHGYGKQTA